MKPVTNIVAGSKFSSSSACIHSGGGNPWIHFYEITPTIILIFSVGELIFNNVSPFKNIPTVSSWVVNWWVMLLLKPSAHIISIFLIIMFNNGITGEKQLSCLKSPWPIYTAI